MIIKEKRYIKKCDCGTEIIYTRRDCYHNTTWDIYSLYCPSCSHEYSYRRGTHHDLFDKEYEEDSVDKDEEIERLNNIIFNQNKRNSHQRIANDNLQNKNKELNNIINELREMLEHKVEFHKNLDFYEDKELETQVYYNYVACLQDFNEIVEKYKLGG